jgi:hypothetical protein
MCQEVVEVRIPCYQADGLASARISLVCAFSRVMYMRRVCADCRNSDTLPHTMTSTRERIVHSARCDRGRSCGTRKHSPSLRPAVNQLVSWVLLISPLPPGFKWINGVSLSSVRLGIACLSLSLSVSLWVSNEPAVCGVATITRPVSRRDGQLSMCVTQRDGHWSSVVQRPEIFLQVADGWPESRSS